MKRANLVLLILFASFLFGHAGEKIPLEKAIQDGLKMDYDYLNRTLDQERAELRQQLVSKNRLFRLDFNASYLYKSETIVLDFPSTQIPGLGVIPGRQVEAGLNHNYDLKLSLTQPLFTGGVLSNSVKLEEVRKAVEVNQKALKSNEIAGLIKSSYFRHLLLVRKKQSLILLKKTLDLHRKKIADFLLEEMVGRTDLLETLSKMEEIQLNIEDLEQKIEDERIHFHTLCGHYPDGIDDSYREKFLNMDEALAFFGQHHPVLKTLQNQADILALQKRITAGKYLPQVSGFAEVHYGRPGIDFFEKEWSLYFQGGIVLDVPLFDWGKQRGEQNLLELQERKLENQKKQYIRDVTEALKQLYTSLRAMEKKANRVDQLLAYSREDAELKAALYAEKQIPNIDYLAALLNREKNSLKREEILIQMENVKVNIATLIGKNKEDRKK
jgi:outer membrane protein TolC